MVKRKYYKYHELPDLLDCSIGDLEDYVYNQHLIKPVLKYKGYIIKSDLLPLINSNKISTKKLAVNLKPQYVDGEFETDLSSYGVIKVISVPEFDRTIIKRVFLNNQQYSIVELPTPNNTRLPKRLCYESHTDFLAAPNELMFLKSTVDRFIVTMHVDEVDDVAQAGESVSTIYMQTNGVNSGDIQKTKMTIREQGYATRKQLAIITNKSISTLSNIASQKPNESGWDKVHKHYSTENIKRYYGVNTTD